MALPPFNKMQQEAIDFCLDRYFSGWFMPPGMGKTRAWLQVIKATRGRTLVVAPKLVCMNTWPAERRKWGYDSAFSMRFLHGRDRHLRKLPDVSLINYEALPWLVEEARAAREFPFESVIFDEVSRIKNPESKRFQAFERIMGRFKFRNGGTGTPVGAHLKDLYGEMFMIDGGLSLGNDFERFKREHFYENEYTQRLEPYHDAEEMILRKLRPQAVSFDINDLDMPPLVHIPEWLQLPAGARQYYEEMHANSFVEDLDVSAVNAAVRSGKLRQLASGGVIDDTGERRYLHDVKSERLKEIIEELQGQPVLIFFEFLSDYAAICRALKQDVPALYGGTKTRDANRLITDWNAGRLPFFALHPRSAAYGLNLQDSGRVLVWYSLPWSYEMVNQGIARLWRQGQKNRVLTYYLLVNDTIDCTVYDRVQEREGTHYRIMKGLMQ